MDFANNKLRLYKINIDYIKYLYSFDKNVYYTDEDNYENKPYVGIMVNVNDYKYFIPLTSGKERHKELDNSGDSYIMLYENIPLAAMMKTRTEDWVCKNITINGEIFTKHILSLLEIKKMIPVPDGEYKLININEMSESGTKRLLIKEYEFLRGKQNSIIKKASKLYQKQIETGKIYDMYCNFSLLEKKSKEYK